MKKIIKRITLLLTLTIVLDACTHQKPACGNKRQHKARAKSINKMLGNYQYR